MNHKILLIDNDEMFAQHLRQACVNEKLDLIVSTSAAQGIDIAWGELPSAIVLSVELPDTNGFIVCSAIKENPKLRKIPLILVSSKTNQETFKRHMSLRGRADQYFQKASPISNLTSILLPLLLSSRENWLSEISSIPGEKPIFKKPTSSILVWSIGAILVIAAILFLITLK